MFDVSVVIGVFNGEGTVEATVRSLLQQSYASIEIIAVNDGSSDSSGSMLDALAARDGRMRVLHQANTGLTVALGRGCAAARGEFIARQDCGDLSSPSRLLLQVKAMRADPALAFVSCFTQYADDQGLTLYEARGVGFATAPINVIDLTKPHGVLDGPTHHGSVMFRRSAYEQVGGYRADFYYGQDWDLWYRLAEVGKFQVIPEMLYEARLNEKDISLNNKARQELIGHESLRALKLRQAGVSDQPALDAASKIRPGGVAVVPTSKRGAGAYFIGECLRKNGNMRPAREYLKRAIGSDPLNAKAWARLAQSYLS